MPRVLGAVAVLSGALSAAGFAMMSPPAQSTPEFLSEFNSRYDTRGTRLDTCATCHTSEQPSVPELNPYGADFSKHNRDFAAIEGLDSDGDGFSNIDEIRAGTFPGDPNENPANPPTTTTTTEPPTTTTTRPFPFSLLPESLPQAGR